MTKKSESYWLIEKQKTYGGTGAHWFSERRCFAQGDQDLWVEDVTRAERFATKEAANKSIIDRFTVEGEFKPDDVYPAIPYATEHIDHGGPALASLEAKE